MPGARVTVEECNRLRVPVLLDACVLIDATRQRDGPVFVTMTSLDLALRFVAPVTLFEVAFARTRRGHAVRTLEDIHAWVKDRATILPFDERGASSVTRANATPRP